jgi:hypothetical protein
MSASTAPSNCCASASTIHGSAASQTAQRGTPRAATATRFFLPQFLHLTIAGSAIVGPRPT